MLDITVESHNISRAVLRSTSSCGVYATDSSVCLTHGANYQLLGFAEVKRPIHIGLSHPGLHKQPFIRHYESASHPNSKLNSNLSSVDRLPKHMAVRINVQTTHTQVWMLIFFFFLHRIEGTFSSFFPFSFLCKINK